MGSDMTSDETKKTSIADLMLGHTGADETLRHHEARRQARRLGDLEQRFEHVLATIDVQQDALRRLVHERAVDQEQIEKLIASNSELRGELGSIKAELFLIKRDIAIVTESLGGLTEP